jgi:hypothetical protein
MLEFLFITVFLILITCIIITVEKLTTGNTKQLQVKIPKMPTVKLNEEDVRRKAYYIAAADSFKKNPETYWHQAEEELKEGKK